MALPASGAISFSDINTELGNQATATISLNDSAVRDLWGVASGAMSMSAGYGCSAVTSPTTVGEYYSGDGGWYWNCWTAPSGGTYYYFMSDIGYGMQYHGSTPATPNNAEGCVTTQQLGQSSAYCLEYCFKNMTCNGKSDWFVPSQDEFANNFNAHCGCTRSPAPTGQTLGSGTMVDQTSQVAHRTNTPTNVNIGGPQYPNLATYGWFTGQTAFFQGQAQSSGAGFDALFKCTNSNRNVAMRRTCVNCY